ncbi:Transcriptional regulator CtsR [Apilactobacillus kunkeei]|uniref:Transcriptional regulator CtsR n=1 Tax=Apilactobacillus kunkeei DSM 12361 = ATCC 700308 TaxID=1423768 RepID=A0A0R1FKP3_9LACO|nr:CtsR family transcriptional regulator [Apilactobacillus kunkeei]KOY72657.1 Transcriptional regulator CtsR [Apilactobacillus kunkeei DSM 12361 = ATCC 700308]KRK22405.1 transcriptional regulator CtsR [Apilactobacillus kunkeei DSM 12361 = ATCC 700308]MCK8620466.1 CtsR family transcriptional regulator [Apilactobacillus kunkeei]MCK8633799.1 CtsR family transcriptional regulator [Apilactobacillus kunkeei]MCK8635560.1 CtsR family transcriptional regulator [Apilactobacillus kunkeei]
MQGKNISDIIEKYLKEMIAEDERVEISRSDIASHFDVVPSQINYVIKTRFTIQNGYVVESKRGGGGYIRIEKVKLLDNIDILDTLINAIGDGLTQREGKAIINTLVLNDLITDNEADLVLASINKQTLSIGNKLLENEIRANIMVAILDHLRYKS